VVSGGFVEVVEPLRAGLGIDHAVANALEVRDGRLTGRTLGPVVDRAAKEAYLRRWAAADGVPLERVVAVGDGANDLDMLGAAGFGVAFRAKPVVQEEADAAVTFPRLDAVWGLLGR
jgi:phosphoserine phosphatase